MLIRLTDNVTIAADDVSEIKVDSIYNLLYVKMKDGTQHSLYPNYGESIYAASDRLTNTINNTILHYRGLDK